MDRRDRPTNGSSSTQRRPSERSRAPRRVVRPRVAPDAPPARERFLSADAYRSAREWQRYEGTGQRALFRTLRERFLDRHRVGSGWVLDVGSGPGRFTPKVGAPKARRVAVDLSAAMLRELAERWPARSVDLSEPPERVRADVLAPPFPDATFQEVVLLGNLVGFAGHGGNALLTAAARLLRPDGLLIVELAPGPGEVSRYLRRLPPGAVRRLLRSPVRAVASRVAREGFDALAWRRGPREEFARWSVEALAQALRIEGFDLLERMAVAPALGSEVERLEVVHADPKAWEHLLELEERLGREPGRWPAAAAVLVALRRPASVSRIK